MNYSQNRFRSFVTNGLIGLGLVVIIVSITQGANGLIGALLLLLLSSVFISLVTWFTGQVGRLVRRGG